MIEIVWMALWVCALVLGVGVVSLVEKTERRWAALGSLAVALAIAVGFAVSTHLKGASIVVGPLLVDSVSITVAPAMLIGAIGLVLQAGRADASGHPLAWLLGVLALESVALLAGSFTLLVVVEAAAALTLSVQAHRGQRRTHAAYLASSAILFLIAAGFAISGSALAYGPAVLAALIRLGVFPFATGMLAALERGLTLETLVAALPFGGVLVLIRVNHLLAGSSALAWVHDLLLFSAVLAAALAIVQRDLSRSSGYMLAAVHALIALGALDPTVTGQLGGELLWASALLTASGFGAAANLVVLRLGSPDLSRHHGLHHNAPSLSLGFLILGLGLAGAPGTIEFIADDVLLSSTDANGLLSMAFVVVTLALVGFNVLRLHFRIFFGASVPERSYLRTKPRERLGLALVGGAVVLGGLAPGLIPLVSAAAGGH